MSTGTIIAIVVVAVVVIALVAFVSRRRRLEGRRVQARELREEAQGREERAQHLRDAAEQELRFAREHHEKAAQVDPDTDADEVTTGRGAGAA